MNTKTKHIAGAGIGLLTLVGQAGAEIVGYERYTYDASGNIVEKQIDDQVTRFDYKGNILKSSDRGTTYGYDSAGRLVGELREGRVQRKLTYQFGNKVTRVEKGGTAAEIFYNAEGQLVGRNSSGQTEAFAWDGLGLVMRGDRAYANEDHIVGGVPTLTNGEVTVSDPLGSTLNVGEKSFAATAFGEGLEGALFTGKPFVEGLDDFVFKYRNYSAEKVRWSLADPIGFPDGLNNLAYANNDPVANVDPLGLQWISLGKPPTGQIRGTLYPIAPTQAPIIFNTTTRWAKKWTNSGWDYATAHDDSVAKNTTLDGTFHRSTSTSTSISLGAETNTISVGVEMQTTTSVGTSQNYHKDADPDLAWRARGLVGSGSVAMMENTYEWNSSTSKWVHTVSNGSTDATGVRIPEVSGLEYFEQ